MLLQRLGDLERAPGRLFRAVAEDERHPVAGRQPNELFVRRFAHLRRREHDRGELVQPLLLFLDQELRVTDDVDERTCPISRRRLSSESDMQHCLQNGRRGKRTNSPGSRPRPALSDCSEIAGFPLEVTYNNDVPPVTESYFSGG